MSGSCNEEPCMRLSFLVCVIWFKGGWVADSYPTGGIGTFVQQGRDFISRESNLMKWFISKLQEQTMNEEENRVV